MGLDAGPTGLNVKPKEHKVMGIEELGPAKWIGSQCQSSCDFNFISTITHMYVSIISPFCLFRMYIENEPKPNQYTFH